MQASGLWLFSTNCFPCVPLALNSLPLGKDRKIDWSQHCDYNPHYHNPHLLLQKWEPQRPQAAAQN